MRNTIPPFFLSLSLGLVFMVFPITAAQAQQTGTLNGLVQDESGRPVAGINVVVEGTTLGAASDSRGRFAIRRVPAGRRVLTASRVGYTTWRDTVEVAAGQATFVEIRMPSTILELDEAEVVATRNRIQAAFEASYTAAKASASVDGETTRDYNSANTYDALRLVPGVSYMNSAGGRLGKPSRIRGGSAWAIADVIEDFPSLREAGIGAEDGGLTADLGASIPAISVQRIDVKKGSLGVLYSGDADGGVIVNELKRGHSGTPTGTLWLELNPIAERLLMGDVGGGTERFDYYVAAKVLSGDYQDMVDPAGRVMEDDRFYSGLVRLGYNLRSDMRLELFGLRGRDNINYHIRQNDDEATGVDESLALPPNEFETTNTNNFAGVTFDHTLGAHLSYELGYSLFHQKALRFSITEDAAHRDRPETAHTVFGNTYLSHAFSDALRYHGKAGFETVSHRQQERAQGSDKDQRFRDNSVFLANSLVIADRLTLNGGARYVYATDDFDTHHILVYDAGASYRLPRIDTKVRAAYSTGYSRNTGFAYFFGPIEEAGGVKLGENRTLEAGLDQPFSLFAGSGGTLSVTGFWTINENVPVFSGWERGVVDYQDRDVQGLEVALDYDLPRGVRLFGSFAYMDTEITDTTHPDGVQVGNTGVQVPRYTGALGAEWAPIQPLRLTLLGTYDDGMRSRIIDQATNETTVTTSTAYTRLNAAVDYDITERFTARLRVENLLNETDLGYSKEVFGPDGYTFTETVAKDPGRFFSLALVMSL